MRVQQFSVIAAVAVLAFWSSAIAEPPGEKQVVRESKLGERFDAGRKWAIVVGVNSYLDPAIPMLEFCVADARLVAKTLIEKCGYEEKRILVLADDQTENYLKPLGINLRKQLQIRLKMAEPNDTVLVYFSGHGFPDARGQSFLAPLDCEMANLGLTGFRIDDLRDMLQQCAAKQKVLILDCCHSGGKGEGQGASSEILAGSFATAKGLVTLASCAKEERSLEWKTKQQGLFTYYLAQGLGGAADYDRDGIVNSDELYRYTSDEVPLAAQRNLNGAVQTPKRIIGEDATGVFALARVDRAPSLNPMPVPTPMPVPPPMPIPPASSPVANSPKPGEVITNTISMKLAYLPPGAFEMGSPAGETGRGDDETQHRVKLTRGFHLGVTEVTQGQWTAVMGTQPWSGKECVKEGANYPATYVNWDDAQEFVKKLSAKEGKTYRLPTEAEWEYACRAGSQTTYSFGNDASRLGEYAWFDGNAYDIGEKYAHEVAQKKANAFGLYDMHGNAWEWCGDWYGDYAGIAVDPVGASSGHQRVLRGGSWGVNPEYARASNRDGSTPENRYDSIGFRVLLSPRTP